MAKRFADKELTHDNWDQEGQAGVFRIASKEVLEKREIIKAKRRGVTDETGGADAFKGFSFGSTTTAAGSLDSRPFSFSMQPNSTTSESTSKPVVGGYSVAAPTVTSMAPPVSVPPVSKSGSPKTSGDSKAQYLQGLRALNEGVLHWIDDHIKTTPCCILTPVFNDYEKYIKELDRNFPQSSNKVFGKTPVASTAAAGFSFASSSVGTSSTVLSSAVSNSQTKDANAPVSGFSFGTQPSKELATSLAAKDANSHISGFSFGQPSKEATKTSGFFFGAPPSTEPASVQASKEANPISGFNFGAQRSKEATSASTPAVASTSAGGKNDNYVPPKANVVYVQEDDAFYTVRCKMYYKIGEDYKDRGIGNLYLKPCGEKTQLLVRAETSGKILLNIILNKNIRTNRQGSNVKMVCVPNPPLDEDKPDDKTPIVMLLRVKTEEDAETLLKHINDHK